MASEAALRCGERIRLAREAKNWTRRELARNMPGKVDGPSISRWERGIVMPGPSNLDALAATLGQDVSYFMYPESEAAHSAASVPPDALQLDRIEVKLDALLEHFSLADPGEELEALLEDEVARQAEEPAADTEEDGRDRAA